MPHRDISAPVSVPPCQCPGRDWTQSRRACALHYCTHVGFKPRRSRFIDGNSGEAWLGRWRARSAPGLVCCGGRLIPCVRAGVCSVGELRWAKPGSSQNGVSSCLEGFRICTLSAYLGLTLFMCAGKVYPGIRVRTGDELGCLGRI